MHFYLPSSKAARTKGAREGEASVVCIDRIVSTAKGHRTAMLTDFFVASKVTAIRIYPLALLALVHRRHSEMNQEFSERSEAEVNLFPGKSWGFWTV
jgi:hypothetical protein